MGLSAVDCMCFVRPGGQDGGQGLFCFLLMTCARQCRTLKAYIVPPSTMYRVPSGA